MLDSTLDSNIITITKTHTAGGKKHYDRKENRRNKNKHNYRIIVFHKKKKNYQETAITKKK